MKQGDDNALDLFVRKYYQEILSYCHYHCSDKTYAEDLTQETFIRFFTKLPDYLHFTAASGHDSVLERPLYGAKRPHCNY